MYIYLHKLEFTLAEAYEARYLIRKSLIKNRGRVEKRIGDYYQFTYIPLSI